MRCVREGEEASVGRFRDAGEARPRSRQRQHWMITLERRPAPKFFTSNRFDSLRVRATEFYNVSASRRRQQRFDFSEVTKQIYPAVAQAWLGKLPLKCAYCENVLPDHSYIGLHRPRGRATRFDGTVD